ncbi:MAG TPA: acyltransferase [Puia sp.]|nr:acyltransferase [Puia sp.]
MFLQLRNTYIEQRTEKFAPLVKKRISWSDHARGLAIMLVVYRHIVVGAQRANIPVSAIMFNMQEVFYNFRMAIFFVLSGLFVANSLRKKSTGEVLKNRFNKIMYPYLVWGFIMMSLQVIFSRFTNSKRHWYELINIIINPRDVDHLWYLYILFTCSALYLLFYSLTKNKWVNAFLAIALHVLNFYFISFLYDYGLISDTFIYYIYFFIGTCLPSLLLDDQKSRSFLGLRNLLWLIPLFLAGQYFWFIHKDDRNTYYAIFVVINLAACYVVFILTNLLANYKSTRWLSYLGRYSLYIYILHVSISAVLRTIYLHSGIVINTWILLFLLWLGGLLIPIFIINLGRPYGIERLFSLKTKSDS